jgi:hypothetical protein
MNGSTHGLYTFSALEGRKLVAQGATLGSKHHMLFKPWKGDRYDPKPTDTLQNNNAGDTTLLRISGTQM